MNYRWDFYSSPDTNVVKDLMTSLGVDQVLARVLAQRGISNFGQAKKFFRPQLSDLHNPFLMRDMEKAVELVSSAKQKRQKIMIYGDYDVDGTTSVALVSTFLKDHFSEIITYVPDRYKEGYGISIKGMDVGKSKDAALIIALDCGIKAHKAIAHAKSLGMDIVVCDHHLPGKELPVADAILDPKREDCDYPYKELSGCGIGLKLVQALAEKWHLPHDSWQSLLDLVAISIGSDIVPITGENRTLAHFGLKKLNTNPQRGLAMLMDLSQRKPSQWNINEVVFQIGPRINAAGRLAHGNLAVELLTTKEDKALEQIGLKINEHNQNRKEIDQKTTKTALQTIVSLGEENKNSTVVFNPEWHKGVIGIVASRLIETYYRPTIVFTESKGMLTGSARSVNGFNIHHALEECAPLLQQFGGHAHAAGMSLEVKNFEAFKQTFETVVGQLITEEQKSPTLFIDAELPFSAISAKFYRILKQFEPFGPHNPNPLFVTHNLHDLGHSRKVGGDQKHLKLQVHCPKTNLMLEGIGFNLGDKLDVLQSGKPVSLAYHLDENDFNNVKTLQLRVLDLKPTAEVLKD